MSDRQHQLDTIVNLWGSFWRFKPSPEELATLLSETRNWPDLAPIEASIRMATQTLDDRPTVAWIMGEAKRRREGPTRDTRRMCPECRGQRWVTEAGSPMVALRPCPECNPLGAELHAAGAWDVDAPIVSRGDGNPKAQAIIDRHRSEGPPSGRTVLMAAPEPMTDTSRAYWRRHRIASHHVAVARANRWAYLARLARSARVDVETPPVGDEDAVAAVVSRLREAGVAVDQAVVDVPTAEQFMAGAKVTPAPGGRDSGGSVASALLASISTHRTNVVDTSPGGGVR